MHSLRLKGCSVTFALASALLRLSTGVASAQAVPVSVSASGGSSGGSVNSSQVLSFVISDPAGTMDIKGANILINSSFSGLNACWLYYDKDANSLSLAADDESAWNYASLGGPGALINHQCIVSWTGQAPTVTTAGNTLTLTLTFNFSVAGLKTIYVRAIGGSIDSGYQALGAWSVYSGPVGFTLDVQPNPDAASKPKILAGGSLSWTLNIIRMNGYNQDVPVFATPPPGFSVVVTPSVIPAGSTSATVTVTSPATALPGMYSVSFSAGDRYTERYFGILNGKPPSLSSYDEYKGTEGFHAILAKASDPSGGENIAGMNVLINYSLTGQNACWFYIPLNDNNLDRPTFANDTATVWSTFPAESRAAVPNASNSQCTIVQATNNVGGTYNERFGSVTDRGVLFALAFSSSFKGPKSVWLRAWNKQGLDTGYQLVLTTSEQ